MLRLRFVTLAVVVAAVLVVSAPVHAAAAREARATAGELPDTFSSWNVRISDLDSDGRVLRLAFDSPLLGRRVINTVYLPDSYAAEGSPLPVIYALHGTTLPALDNAVTCPATSALGSLTFVQEVACGGGAFQDQLFDIRSQLQAMQFVVVSPDTDPAGAICQTCGWIDGRDDLLPNVYPVMATTVAADSFLHRELYPLVQGLLNVRKDRGGRGVIGFSMGGTAAYLQGMMHPDEYAYVASVSGPYDLKDPAVEAVWAVFGYMRDQGYGSSRTEPLWWRQYNPKGIVENLKGSDIEVMASSGDGCLPPASLASPFCRGRFSPVAGVGGQAELLARQSHRAAIRDFSERDLSLVSVMSPGMHGANNAAVFANDIVPGANAKFRSTVVNPPAFDFWSAQQWFETWDYRFARTESEGFVGIRSATLDGRALTVSGRGTVSITTPPRFDPRVTYRVWRTDEGAASVVADESGRLTLDVELGYSPVSITIRGQR